MSMQTTSAQTAPAPLQGLLGIVVDVVNLVPQLLQAIVDGLTHKPADCGILNNGQQYYVQSAGGRFAVVDGNKQAAYMMQIPASDSSKFTAVQKNCDVYGFCVNGFCMSRCQGCSSDSGDTETVKFHQANSDGGYSQWKLTSGAVGGPYNLQVDNNNYLTYKQTSNGDQLTLSSSSELGQKFRLVAVN